MPATITPVAAILIRAMTPAQTVVDPKVSDCRANVNHGRNAKLYTRSHNPR
jgi:hypothetical protein